MKISQQLKIIIQLSGLTQEKLAQDLGVSFATLNSWLNERSIPHKKKQEKINNLYYKYTGQKEIPKDTLSAKKKIIKKKLSEHKDIIKSIKDNPDVYDEFILALTYNSNRIEGSTLTEAETAAILFENLSIPNKNLKEHLEAKNHQLALKYLFNKIRYNFNISEQFILKLHDILMNGIIEDGGNYRNHAVRIVGANVPTANYLKVPALMKKLIKEINKNNVDIIRHTIKIHSQFEKIHPFSDGNGRIGRLLIHSMLLRKHFPPAVIQQKKKRFYLKYLNISQMKDEYELLDEFICDSILFGFKIIEDRN
ncbi:MAG: Fic family protein [Candidatus Thorarchaeota archaeon]